MDRSSLGPTTHEVRSNRDRTPSPHLALLAVAVVVTFVVVSTSNAHAPVGQTFAKNVDAMGNISLPAEFETEFIHLGSIAVAPERGMPVGELHGTYARAQDIREFQKSGKFPDGAILVKEVRTAKSEALTTGAASYADEMKVWFVMVKDDEGRFKGNNLWGSGWGWALFNGDDRAKQIATDYRIDCRPCHIPAQKTDWIFTQCYPLLKKRAATK